VGVPPLARAASLSLLALGPLLAGGCLTSRIRYDEETAPPPRSAAAEAASTRDRFLTYTGDGRIAGDLVSIARSYRREDGAEVLLLAMIHYAEPSFYETVARRIAGADLVLLEGSAGAAPREPSEQAAPPFVEASDETGRIFASLDLAPQPTAEALGPPGPRYLRGDVPPAELDARVAAAQRSGDAQEAQEFPGTSFGWDRFWYGLVGRTTHFRRVWRHTFAARLRPLDQRAIHEILIEPRNETLLSRLDEELARRPKSSPPKRFRVVVPWGAEHMPGIEGGLLARRFAPADVERITAWRVRSYEAP